MASYNSRASYEWFCNTLNYKLKSVKRLYLQKKKLQAAKNTTKTMGHYQLLFKQEQRT